MSSEARLGINLAGPSDWISELAFVDVFRTSRPWVSQQTGKPWGQGPSLSLDEHGWVKSLAPNCFAETVLCTIEGGHYPSGTYTVLFDGEGEIKASVAASVVERGPGKLLLKVDAKRGPIHLQLLKTNPQNYVRNIRVVMPGFADAYQEEPWHPNLLERWQGFACLRFMDFMHTNDSKISTWDDRPKVEDATFSESGVPLEMMCDLANRTKIAPWFCIPHLADDDYVRNFARQTKNLVDLELPIYIEYSNEVWNGQFGQNKYAGRRGQELGLADKPWEAAWKFTGIRSVEIFKIFEEVFGGTERLVRVLPSQAANAYVSRQIVTSGDAYKHADALAIAPYFSMNVAAKDAALVVGLGVDGVLDKVEAESLPEATKWMKENKAVAEEFGLKLVAYEAGQHLVGIQGAENNGELTKLLHAVNRHQRMGEIYRQYYDAWKEAGGDLMCVFSSVGAWTKWGSWGLVEYYDDTAADSPKMKATIQWAQDNGQQARL